MFSIKQTVVIVIFLIIVLLNNVCFSEIVTVTASGSYTISKNEKISDGEEAAFKEAVRTAIEKTAILVRSYTKVINGVLEEDMVETFASSVIKVTKKNVKPIVKDDNIIIIVDITAMINTDDIKNYDLERQRQLEQENEKLKNTIINDRQERLMAAVGNSSRGTAEIILTVLGKTDKLISANQYKQADNLLTDTIKGGIQDHRLYYRRGLLNIERAQLSAAEQDLSSAINLEKLSEYYKIRGDIRFKLQKYDLATLDYQTAVKIDKDNAGAWANLGACMWYHNNVAPCLKYYDIASSLGLAKAKRIRYNLRGQYHSKWMIRNETARKILPLC